MAVPQPMIVPIRVVNEAGVSERDVQTYLDRMNALTAPRRGTDGITFVLDGPVRSTAVSEDFIAGPPQMQRNGTIQPGVRREIGQVRRDRAGQDYHGIVAILVPTLEQVDARGTQLPTSQQSSEGIALTGNDAAANTMVVGVNDPRTTVGAAGRLPPTEVGNTMTHEAAHLGNQHHVRTHGNLMNEDHVPGDPVTLTVGQINAMRTWYHQHHLDRPPPRQSPSSRPPGH